MSQPIPPHAPWLPAGLLGGTPPLTDERRRLVQWDVGATVSFNPAFP